MRNGIEELYVSNQYGNEYIIYNMEDPFGFFIKLNENSFTEELIMEALSDLTDEYKLKLVDNDIYFVSKFEETRNILKRVIEAKNNAREKLNKLLQANDKILKQFGVHR